MTKVDIISGFLGAGKTTLIAKLLKEAFPGEQVVLIENEFGEIGIDGGFLKESGVEIREMNSGCICCSLVGDFGTSLKEVVEKYHPDRIIIEPSGVGKLSDVIKAVKDLHIENEIRLNSASTVADASKVKVYMKNFGEFFNNQIEHAGTIILSRTQNVSEAKLKTDIELIRSLNKDAHIITTPWDDINGKQILDAMENVTNLELEMLAEAAAKVAEEHEHHHHHHDHEEERGCGHDQEQEHHQEHDEGRISLTKGGQIWQKVRRQKNSTPTRRSLWFSPQWARIMRPQYTSTCLTMRSRRFPPRSQSWNISLSTWSRAFSMSSTSIA